MSEQIITLVASALLSGGGVGAAVSIYTARKKVPVERDSIVVSGAETAVLSLERSLQAETRRAERAEIALADRDRRIASLEVKLDEVQRLLDNTRNELASLLNDMRKNH